jgi:PIN domain nuclease of toxin-antitoxin system
MSLQEGKTFSDKHTTDMSIDPSIQESINTQKKDNTISCAVAFEIAKQLEVSPQQVGTTIDLMNLKLIKCQIGLFGYSTGKKLTPDSEPDSSLKDTILSAATDSRLPCEKAWEIADKLNIGKMALGNASEGLAIKIKPCQLGAF